MYHTRIHTIEFDSLEELEDYANGFGSTRYNVRYNVRVEREGGKKTYLLVVTYTQEEEKDNEEINYNK
jgi:hypothetical protein